MGLLHIAKSGWFPFCVLPAAAVWDGTGFPLPGQVGPGTFYPLGVPLATAMRWYWKAKGWHVAADLVLSGTRADPPYAFSLPLSADADVAGTATQAARVCPSPVSYDDGTLLLTLWTAASQAYRLGDLFYPCLRVRLVSDSLTVSTYRPDLSFPKPWTAGGTFDGSALSLWYDEVSDYDGTGGAPGDHGTWTQSQAGTVTVAIPERF